MKPMAEATGEYRELWQVCYFHGAAMKPMAEATGEVSHPPAMPRP